MAVHIRTAVRIPFVHIEMNSNSNDISKQRVVQGLMMMMMMMMMMMSVALNMSQYIAFLQYALAQVQASAFTVAMSETPHQEMNGGA